MRRKGMSYIGRVCSSEAFQDYCKFDNPDWHTRHRFGYVGSEQMDREYRSNWGRTVQVFNWRPRIPLLDGSRSTARC
ncbi:hypothetical protein PMAYCL1PPCAC_19706 [Pristionchus mayeri]|uniref:Uncharacterized protein n=1 Tax=Pristionchus mayeri TaxID=1317129 RepID=A0AAN5CRV3_9BILA|nr:hypothetical protein PMAYCL1PPCAC_19706 [Pristionchus mayeri]